MTAAKSLPKVTGDKKEIRYARGQNPKSKANLKPAEKGEIRNPKGKAPGTKDRATVLKKWLEIPQTVVDDDTQTTIEGTVEDEVMLALIREARKGNVVAIKEIQDTLHGKLKDVVANEGDVTVRVEYVGA